MNRHTCVPVFIARQYLYSLLGHYPKGSMMYLVIEDRYTRANRFRCKLPSDFEGSAEAQLGFAVKEAIRSGVSLRSCDLRGADLTDLCLRNVDFSYSDLGGALLVRAQCIGCVFEGVDMQQAKLSCGNFHGSSFHGADLSSVEAISADFSCAILDQVSFFSAVLRESYFSCSHMEKAYLPGADFKGANLAGICLYLSDFSKANMAGSVLCEGTSPVIVTGPWSMISLAGIPPRGSSAQIWRTSQGAFLSSFDYQGLIGKMPQRARADLPPEIKVLLDIGNTWFHALSIAKAA